MPISGPSSYIVVVPAFINHWTDANALGSLITIDGTALGQLSDVGISYLQGLQTELLGARDTLETTNVDLGISSGNVLGHKTWLQAQCVAFNKAVRADHSTTAFVDVLPQAPQVSDGREKFNKPVRMLLTLWARVNTYRAALVPPKSALTLPASLTAITLATMTARLATMLAEQNTHEEREQQAALDRLKRENVQDRIYPVLKIYRQKIEASFAPTAAIVLSLPELTDSGAGTPEPGVLTAALNAAGTEVVMTGTVSPSATVASHQLRASVGEEPQSDEESMRAEFPLGMPIALTTDYGLGVPGARVHWRLVAITADGHERATPWQSFQRPL